MRAQIKTDMRANFKKNLIMILIISTSPFLSLSCGVDDTPPPKTPQELATGILTSSGWSLANGGSITRDSQDISDQYTGLTASFTFSENTTNTYTTTNSGGSSGQNRLFLASGTWGWANATTSNLIDLMDNDKGDVTIVTLTESTLTFRFNQLSNAGIAAGSDGLSGAYQVNLTK